MNTRHQHPADANMPRPVLTSAAPVPAGHYSQAIVFGGLVYVSGQLPIDPAHPTGVLAASATPPPEDIEAQTTRALQNLEAILHAAGSSCALLLRCTVYIRDVSLWPRVNEAYLRFLSARAPVAPARTVVPTGPLHYGYGVEIDAVAALAPAVKFRPAEP